MKKISSSNKYSSKHVLVTGAGGFVASHLVKRLKNDGCWVRAVDIKEPDFSPTKADEFLLLDLRDRGNCVKALSRPGGFDEVYHLAADMGGMGYISSAECEIMTNSTLMNVHMINSAVETKAKRYFFSSSVCIYRDMKAGEAALDEAAAYPAMPDNEYGWEKLYAERVALAFGRRHKMAVRIARFQNCYGPEGAWEGGREKAPAAISRKVAQAGDGGTIDVWGDGKAVRSYIYVDDLVDGIIRLMASDIDQPANIGSPEYVSVDELVRIVSDVAGKKISIRHVDGPVGVASRNFSNDRIYSTGWKCRFSLKEGMKLTYDWVAQQVNRSSRGGLQSRSRLEA